MTKWEVLLGRPEFEQQAVDFCREARRYLSSRKNLWSAVTDATLENMHMINFLPTEDERVLIQAEKAARKIMYASERDSASFNTVFVMIQSLSDKKSIKALGEAKKVIRDLAEKHKVSGSEEKIELEGLCWKYEAKFS